MPDLAESLHSRDLGFLRIVARLWGIDLHAPDARSALRSLLPQLLDPDLVEQAYQELPESAQLALADLVAAAGRLPWASFTRRFGTVREMGSGRRDRERPYQVSPTPSETLWYRAFIHKAFFDTPAGPEEFAYIPEDLFLLIPSETAAPTTLPGRPASPSERAVLFPANDRILDQATTWLAYLRLRSIDPDLSINPESVIGPNGLAASVLEGLLAAAGLLDPNGQPISEPVREFLEADRAQALLILNRGWIGSQSFNELGLMPALRIEGQTSNDPLRARQAVLHALAKIPARAWWSMNAFVDGIHQQSPDFQRPAGDYDSWFIKSVHTGEYWRGFENWHQVEGALLRFILSVPMHWLGLIDLARPTQEHATEYTAFRYSGWAASLLEDKPPLGLPVEDQSIFVRADGTILVARCAPRAVRYQIARFTHWESSEPELFRYRVTPASLTQARLQGLRTTQLILLLRKHAENVSPTLVKSLERWDAAGVEAHIQSLVVLRLSNAELLQALRSSPAGRFLGEPLGPTAVIVKPGAVEKLLASLAEMGYLGQSDLRWQE